MILLTDDKIAEVAVLCWPTLEEHERRAFQLVAKEAARKVLDEIEKVGMIKDSPNTDFLPNGLVFLSSTQWQVFRKEVE